MQTDALQRHRNTPLVDELKLSTGYVRERFLDKTMFREVPGSREKYGFPEQEPVMSYADAAKRLPEIEVTVLEALVRFGIAMKSLEMVDFRKKEAASSSPLQVVSHDRSVSDWISSLAHLDDVDREDRLIDLIDDGTDLLIPGKIVAASEKAVEAAATTRARVRLELLAEIKNSYAGNDGRSFAAVAAEGMSQLRELTIALFNAGTLRSEVAIPMIEGDPDTALSRAADDYRIRSASAPSAQA